jgi:hypothetical protein
VLLEPQSKVNAPVCSVILCTHNPRPSYLDRTLHALKHQTLTSDTWELVVVDNCSDIPISEQLDGDWHLKAKIVREETLGLTPARLRGIGEARSDLFVFVDDDNVLDPDYLQVTLRTAAERPWLGAWSGQCRAGFDEIPPEWTRRYWGNLVIREFNQDVWSNLPRLPDSMPCGAGLVVRRNVAEHYRKVITAGQRRLQLDRTGTSLLSGGDNDLAACACDLGLGVGLISSLRLTHLIPPQRLTPDYLARLAEGIAYSSVILDADRGLFVPPRSTIGLVADALRVLRQRRPHGRILAAAFRGRNRALRELARSSQGYTIS